MPPELWSRALEQAAEHGVAAVARVARLDYGSLSNRLAQSCGETSAVQDALMRFVTAELSGADPFDYLVWSFAARPSRLA